MSIPDIPDLDYECRYCNSTEVVPVLDKQIEQAPKAGNKYRRHCLSCWRWLPMCSASFFRAHDDPHVLPVDAGSERLNLVPLDDYRDDSATRDMDEQRAVNDMTDDPAPDDIDPDDIEVDTDHITRHPPDTDIDEYVEDCNFRIERMGADGLWVCAYTHDDDEPDHHYDISCREDGLHITHREESDLADEADE